LEVSRREIRRVKVSVPREETEGRLIGRVLEQADEAIAAAEEKLTATRRLKTALMQQLFTRGVPGRHARFKPTKVGMIPEGWSVGRISKVVAGEIANGISPQSRPEPPGTPILNVSCISDGRCDPTKVTYVDLDGPASSILAMRGDFFVLRGNGNRDYVGTGGLLFQGPAEGTVFSDLLIRIPFDPNRTVPGYMPLLWQSQSFLRQLQSKAVSGSGLWKIGLREIRRHEFALPPDDEQAEIVAILGACDNTVEACEVEQEAALRLKRSLLQNLLTGRIRIRN
jgi:type I restriction enzyme S subunit